MTEHSEAKKIN